MYYPFRRVYHDGPTLLTNLLKINHFIPFGPLINVEIRVKIFTATDKQMEKKIH